MNLNNAKSIRIKIMDFLARREHTNKEIYYKLKNKVADLNLLREEIKKLIDEGLIDNKRFAEQYIYSRSTKGYGPLRIEQELYKRGVDQKISQKLLESEDWSKFAKLALQKKKGSNILVDGKGVIKIKRFLNYRGFTNFHIEEAFRLIGSQENDS